MNHGKSGETGVGVTSLCSNIYGCAQIERTCHHTRPHCMLLHLWLAVGLTLLFTAPRPATRTLHMQHTTSRRQRLATIPQTRGTGPARNGATTATHRAHWRRPASRIKARSAAQQSRLPREWVTGPCSWPASTRSGKKPSAETTVIGGKRQPGFGVEGVRGIRGVRGGGHAVAQRTHNKGDTRRKRGGSSRMNVNKFNECGGWRERPR